MVELSAKCGIFIACKIR